MAIPDFPRAPRDVVEFFSLIQQLNLTAQEDMDLVAFMYAL